MIERPETQSPRERALNAYVQRTQASMRLSEWRVYAIDVDHGETLADESETVAEVTFTDNGSLEAWIGVRPIFWTFTPEAQRERIVHELFHVMMRNFGRVADRVIYGGYLPPQVATNGAELVEQEHEAVVTRLAHLYAHLYESPDELALAGWESGNRYGYEIFT